ncbi:MAG: glutamine--tRNA ligase/YqeY domain fusion protein [Oligoflexia bacterium]|nr:glutamine--tRNA ligase/YqeY domain fusion protein [Oligoflexia bacterium]
MTTPVHRSLEPGSPEFDDLASRDFLRAQVAADLAHARYGGQIVTRFPPEPNGYLHIGHAKAIVVNFGIARDFGGRCHLRMDDTNPTTESLEYAENIAADVRWLGFDPGEKMYFASDMYGQLYDLAERLVKRGLAYVDTSTEAEIRELRGTVTQPGRASPDRDRPIAQNLDLFRRMRTGDFPDGSHVLRAKLDLAAPNMVLRDPILYRIKHAHHYRTGDDWCIYPMYDFAHCLGDALEGVTHSICTLEFENNRALYDWVIAATQVSPPEQRPKQYEMARLEIEYIITSKRRLKQLVDNGIVDGWDDPRMPTLAGLRRRGVPPEALVAFIERVGVAKTNSRVEYALFEHTIRDHLNTKAPRLMGVTDPLELVVEDWPADQVDRLSDVPWFPDEAQQGTRTVSFGRRLWIERADFAVDPPKGFKRLVPGGEVRLLHGYAVRHTGHTLDANGRVSQVRVSVDRDTRRGDVDRRMGSIHWVHADTAVPVELRLYDRLFLSPTPTLDPEGRAIVDLVDPDSLRICHGYVEPAVMDAGPRMQLMRTGYFAVDPDSDTDQDGRPRVGGKLVLNRTVALKDGWGRRKRPAPQPIPKADPLGSSGDTDRRKRKKRPHSELRAQARAADPALQAAYDRFLAAGLAPAEADVLSADTATVAFVDAAGASSGDLPAAARFIVHELRGAMQGDDLGELKTDGQAIGALVKMLLAGTLTSRAAKTVVDELLAKGGDPATVVAERGLSSLRDDDAVRVSVQAVLDAHSDEVARYRAGEHKLQGFFMGQLMRATRGKVDPKLARAILLKLLAV